MWPRMASCDSQDHCVERGEEEKGWGREEWREGVGKDKGEEKGWGREG